MRRLVLLLALAGALGAATAPQPLTLAIAERPGLELVEQLAKHCGSGLQAEPSALPLLIGEVSIAFAQVPWEEALEQIAERLHLELVLSDGLLRVSASASPKLSPRRERRIYDLRLFIAGQRDHPGFDLDLPHDEGAVSYIGPPPGAEPETRPEENEFIEILQKQVAPTTWHRGDVSIEEWQGHMVVYQAPAVHEQIARHIAGREADHGWRCAGTRPAMKHPGRVGLRGS